LEELRKELREKDADLYFFYGDTLSILKSLPIQRLGFNLDYTPYARKRDEDIKEWCEENEITCYS
jgi:deoxyribodipyrimidine photolyase